MTPRVLRAALYALASGFLLVGGGFWLRADWALALWPWPDGPLSHLFVASILLGQSAALFWTGGSLELGAARGGAVGFALMCGGLAVTTGWLYAQRGEGLLLGWTVVCAILAAGGASLAALGWRFPWKDTRPVPAVVRGSFLVFAVALAITTVLLLIQVPVVFPWKLKPESSVMFGCLFLASAAYFFDGWRRPGAANAFGQLAAFLVYDLVLLPPYLRHWPKTEGGFRISLVIYLAVLIWSALLAVWYWRRYGFGRRG